MHKTYITDMNIFLLKGSATCITLAWAFPSMHTNLSLDTRLILNLYWSNVDVDSNSAFCCTRSNVNLKLTCHCTLFYVDFP